MPESVEMLRSRMDEEEVGLAEPEELELAGLSLW